MSEPGSFDDMREDAGRMDEPVDPYTTESSADIYATPEVTLDNTGVMVEETSSPAPVMDTHGLFSGSGQSNDSYNAQPDAPYGGQPADPYNSQPGTPYGGQAGSPYGVQPGNPYGGQTYNGTYEGMNNNPYYNNTNQGGNPYNYNPYNSGNTYNNNTNNGDSANGNASYNGDNANGNVSYNGDNTYGSMSYNSGNTYGSTSYSGENTYGNPPYGGENTYGNPPYGGNNTYGNTPYNGNNTYGTGSVYGGNGNPYHGTNPYGQQAGGYGNQPPYGNPPFDNNPYSPYAVPQKKGHTGLIIAIVAIVILLFIVAICALAYRAVQLAGDRVDDIMDDDKYDFDDDYEYHHDDDFHGYDDDDDFFYDDDYEYDYYDYDYDYEYDYGDDGYYYLQDDIKYDLSYGIDFDFFEYETDDEDVNIMVTYPIITGENVPNLEKLNDTIYSEVEIITEYFEEDYAPYMEKNEDSYFSATAICYVTYMDEDKLSVVYQERIYADTYDLAYLECINIDMKNGVVLDNEEMLDIDDEFSVDFRTRSDEQNDEIYALTNMTDQEITGYFNSPDVIVFYTPLGMEIGFNYEEGWVTVTYEEYEQYLKVF